MQNVKLTLSSATNYFWFVSDLQTGDSGLYTCTASSESGETSWSASLSVGGVSGSYHRSPDPATFPRPPSAPRILNTTQSSVTMTWDPPPGPLQSQLIGSLIKFWLIKNVMLGIYVIIGVYIVLWQQSRFSRMWLFDKQTCILLQMKI